MPRLQTPRKSRFTVVLTDASQLIVTGSICHSKFSSQNTIHVRVTSGVSTFGYRAIAAAGSGLWNSLPPRLKEADLSYSRFRLSLKTSSFGVGPRHSVNYFNCAVIEITFLPYLITTTLQKLGGYYF